MHGWTGVARLSQVTAAVVAVQVWERRARGGMIPPGTRDWLYGLGRDVSGRVGSG